MAYYINCGDFIFIVVVINIIVILISLSILHLNANCGLQVKLLCRVSSVIKFTSAAVMASLHISELSVSAVTGSFH